MKNASFFIFFNFYLFIYLFLIIFKKFIYFGCIASYLWHVGPSPSRYGAGPVAVAQAQRSKAYGILVPRSGTELTSPHCKAGS